MDLMTEELYTSRIIKASALIPDTKMLLSSWNPRIGTEENLKRARQENIFGKSSRSRVEDILKIFRQRYFSDPDIGQALVALVQGNTPSSWIDPLLYYYSVLNDLTLRAIVLEVIYTRKMAGYSDLTVEHVIRAIRDWIADGKTSSAWGENTILRVTRNAMAALRDFGVLKGAANKYITPVYLPTEAFAFLALDQFLRLKSGDLVLQSQEWQLFFLPTEGVERFFLEAHQEQLLSYYAAGSVVRLEFPLSQPYLLTDYSHVLLERSFS